MSQENKEVVAEFRALLSVTNKSNPDRQSLAKLGEILDKIPNLANVLGNLMTQIEGQILTNSFPSDKGFALIVSKRLENQRAELGYAGASAIEKSLIEHIIICHLRLITTELRYEKAMQTNPSLAMGQYWESKLSANQRRYLRAVETLARVRRLPAPVILATQINHYK